MAIQYPGGTIVDTTFTNTNGTRREIVDGLVAALASAGWTYHSGQGTGDVVMRSATTPQNLRILMRVYDPGSGNCARVQMRDLSSLKVSQDYYLYPQAGKIWRVLALKYSFVIWVQGGTAAREFVIGGTLWIPSFLVGGIVDDMGFINGNARDDGGNYAASLRYNLCCTNGSYSNWWSGLLNGNMLNSGGHYGEYSGDLTLVLPFSGRLFNSMGYRWHDDTIMIAEPLLSWALSDVGQEGKIRGQMWNAILVSETLSGESTLTFDGHTWVAITHNNTGSVGAKGTLMIAKD